MANLLRPSDAPRWVRCPGGPAFTEGMEDPGSVYAAEGTAKHSLAEMCVSLDVPASSFIGQEIDGFLVDEEFAAQVQWAVDKAEELML